MSQTDSPPEDNEEQSDEWTVSRRDVLAAAGIAAAGPTLGFLAGTAEADSHAGTVGTDSQRFRVWADRVVLVERTSDPSSPDNGEIWYNSSA